MTSQEAALADLTRVLNDARVPYMVIGGLANIIWGEPRATIDIDVTVWVLEPRIPEVADILEHNFTLLVENPCAFIRDTRVLPLQSPGGVRIDVIFGLLPFEEEAIMRAATIEVGGVAVRFCTAEDLILMKIISDRERDLADARAIVRRRLAQLDRGYLEPRIHELSRTLDKPEIEARWHLWSAG